jgi:hypothetical protein
MFINKNEHDNMSINLPKHGKRINFIDMHSFEEVNLAFINYHLTKSGPFAKRLQEVDLEYKRAKSEYKKCMRVVDMYNDYKKRDMLDRYGDDYYLMARANADVHIARETLNDTKVISENIRKGLSEGFTYNKE